MTVKRRDYPSDPRAVKIVKQLDEICVSTGHRPDQVFGDWLILCEFSLSMIARHAVALVETGKMADDPDSVKAEWGRVMSRYSRDEKAITQIFSGALGSLIIECEGNSDDLLGDMYMSWGYPNTALGQFFTPMNVARAMSQMQIADPVTDIVEHLLPAYLGSPAGSMHEMMSPGRAEKFTRESPETVWPLVRHKAEPIKIIDPCCGSGVMLLAAAERFPAWAVRGGLVQLHGVDVDHDCVRMARINLMLRGVDPRFIEHGNSLSMQLLSPLPESYYMGLSKQCQTSM